MGLGHRHPRVVKLFRLVGSTAIPRLELPFCEVLEPPRRPCR
jgi:hypothetical protein